MFHTTLTTDPAQFGIVEQLAAAFLLEAFACPDRNRSHLTAPVCVALHKATGTIFLVDTELNVARTNGSVLEDWRYCWGCGTEGFPDRILGEPFGPHFCTGCRC